MDALVEALHRIEQERLAKRVSDLAGTLIAETVHLAGATSENLTRIALLHAITLDIVAACGKEAAAAHLRDMLASLEAPAGEGRVH